MTKAQATTNFVFMFSENMDDIAKLVSYNEFKVLMYCIKMMRYGNLVSLSPADIAWGALQQTYTSTASKIILSLKKKNIFISDPEAPRSFFVNPNLVAFGGLNNFTGTVKQEEEGWKVDGQGQRQILASKHPLQVSDGPDAYEAAAPIAIATEGKADRLRGEYAQKLKAAAAAELIKKADAKAERIRQKAQEKAAEMLAEPKRKTVKQEPDVLPAMASDLELEF